VPGRLYRRRKQTFVAFRTVHTKESLGFWFPKLGVLYCGDGRVPPQLVRHLIWLTGPHAFPGRVRHIVGDTLYEHVPRLPRLRDSRSQLCRVLAACSPTGCELVCMHSGFTDFLADLPTGSARWALSSSQDWQGQKLLPAALALVSSTRKLKKKDKRGGTVRLLPPSSKSVASGFKFVPLPNRGLPEHRGSRWVVIPSSLWFVVTGVDPVRHPVMVSGRFLRVFVSFHCGADECRRLQAAFPQDAVFEGCPSRPL
jgi:hypothetical protein